MLVVESGRQRRLACPLAAPQEADDDDDLLKAVSAVTRKSRYYDTEVRSQR
jgi:hypothetical protein